METISIQDIILLISVTVYLMIAWSKTSDSTKDANEGCRLENIPQYDH